MNLLVYLFMAFGAILALSGILLFAKRGAEGSNVVKMLGFEFQLSGSALVIFVVGAVIFLAPIVYPESFKERDADRGSIYLQPVKAVPVEPTARPIPTGAIPTQEDQSNTPPESTMPATRSSGKSVDQRNIARRVYQIVRVQLNLKSNIVLTDRSSYIYDLGADELDLVELIMAFEEAFQLEIPDKDAERLQKSTVGETVAWISFRLAHAEGTSQKTK